MAWRNLDVVGGQSELWFTRDSIILIDRVFDFNGKCGIEWGGGGSTGWLLRRTPQRLVTVEHDDRWAAMLKKLYGSFSNWNLVHIRAQSEGLEKCIGLFGHDTAYYDDYVACVDAWKVLPEKIEFAIVDGRARNACLELAVERLVASDGLLVLDDSERERYDLDLVPSHWSRFDTKNIEGKWTTVWLSRRRMSGKSDVMSKRGLELRYWNNIKQNESVLENGHFEHVFTTALSRDLSWYVGLRMLDVGCGPRGSLVWAQNAAKRVGIDPLVEQYVAMGEASKHGMEYQTGTAEKMPFEDESFDVVSCLNVLDYVEDPVKAVREMWRVLAPCGEIIVACSINRSPSLEEWFSFKPRAIESLFPVDPEFNQLYSFHEGLYKTIECGQEQTDMLGPSVLLATFRKPSVDKEEQAQDVEPVIESISKPMAGLPITFVVAAYKCADKIGRCIESLKKQQGEFHVLVAVDNADADTEYAAHRAVGFDKRFSVCCRDKRVYALENRLIEIKQTPADGIVALVDGNDYLLTNDVCKRLQEAYADPDVGAAWSEMEWVGKQPNESHRFDGAALDPRVDPYKQKWSVTHLRSFRKSVFDCVLEGNFRDSSDRFYRRATDLAIMLPILKLSRKTVFIPEKLYAYDWCPAEHDPPEKAWTVEKEIRQRGFVLPSGKSGISVLYVMPSLVVGGSELHFAELARGISALGHRVGILPLCQRGDKLEDAANRIDTSWADEVIEFPKSEEWVDQMWWRYDVVHMTNLLPSQRRIVVENPVGSPVVETIHTPDSLSWLTDNDGAEWESKIAERVCVSRGAKEATDYLYGVDSLLCPCAVPVPETVDEALRWDQKGAIVNVGRVDPNKNQLSFLEIVARSGRSFAQIIGDSDQRYPEYISKVRRRAEELGVQLSVTGFLPRDRALLHLAAASVLVVSSFSEGVPLVVVEAMMLGVPVLCRKCGQVDEIVKDGDTGLFFVDEDEAAEKIKQLQEVERKAMYEEMLCRARVFAVERHDARKVVRWHEALYLSLICARRA